MEKTPIHSPAVLHLRVGRGILELRSSRRTLRTAAHPLRAQQAASARHGEQWRKDRLPPSGNGVEIWSRPEPARH